MRDKYIGLIKSLRLGHFNNVQSEAVCLSGNIKLRGGDARLNKTNASSDKKINGEGFLPAETLWRAAQMICQKGMEVPPINAEPAPMEMIGLTIGILRRRKHISRSRFAQKIGCSMEELLALEAGLLSASEFAKYLPLILKQTEISELLLQPYFRSMKFI
jgi:DNA-binding transcriptional regulator YiaG